MDMNIADDANTESVISVHYKVDRLNGWLAFEHIESKDKTQLNDIEAFNKLNDDCQVVFLTKKD
jgi:hypothetical protein